MTAVRAAGLRWIRIVLLVLCVAVGSLGAAQTVTFKLNADRVDDIQSSRFESIRESCLDSGEQNRSILAFLEDLQARPETLRVARARFPTPSERECEAQARERVRP